MTSLFPQAMPSIKTLVKILFSKKKRRLTQKISYLTVRANNPVTCVSSVENQTCVIMPTDYRHTKAKSLILSGPNSHPQSQINICDVDIKDCSFFVKLLINGKHGQGTHSIKMGANGLAENTQNAPKFICPIPKFWDFDEKRLHWVSVVHNYAYGAPVSNLCFRFSKRKKTPGEKSKEFLHRK